MRRFTGAAAALTLACLSGQVFAQQSAASYGQGGGMAGGGNFGAGGFTGNARRLPGKPAAKSMEKFADDAQALPWTEKALVLSSGGKIDLKVDLKAGQTLVATVASDAFDPALVILGPGGKEVARNDDRDEGDQSPYVAFVAPADGEYKFRVLSNQPGSAGKFTADYRVITSHVAAIGESKFRKDVREDRVIVRLPLVAGHIYDLSSLNHKVETGPGSYLENQAPMSVIGPTGKDEKDYRLVKVNGNPRGFVEALKSGDYYLVYNFQHNGDYTSRYRDVPIRKLPADGSAEFDLKANESVVFELAAKANDIERTVVAGTSLSGGFSWIDKKDDENPNDDESGVQGTNGVAAWYQMNAYNTNDVVRVFQREGTARFALQSPGFPIKGSITNTTKLPEWESAREISETIKVGESRMFLLKSAKSELMRVATSSSQFQPRMDIFTLEGETANTLMSLPNLTAGDDLYFPNQGTFLIWIRCHGDGGLGTFAMNRTTLATTPYALGATVSTRLDAKTYGLYLVNLEAGKRYELLADQTGRPLRVDLLDAEGEFLYSQNIGFGKVTAYYFVPKRSGAHRLWLRGDVDKQTFRMQLHDEPKIGS